jgi:hypothetical protein
MISKTSTDTNSLLQFKLFGHKFITSVQIIFLARHAAIDYTGEAGCFRINALWRHESRQVFSPPSTIPSPLQHLNSQADGGVPAHLLMHMQEEAGGSREQYPPT